MASNRKEELTQKNKFIDPQLPPTYLPTWAGNAGRQVGRYALKTQMRNFKAVNQGTEL